MQPKWPNIEPYYENKKFNQPQLQHQFFRSYFQFLFLYSPPNEKNKSEIITYYGICQGLGQVLRPRTRAVFILRTSLCSRCHDQLVVY